MIGTQVTQYACLDLYTFYIFFQYDLMTCSQLSCAIDTHFGKHIYSLFLSQYVQCLRSSFEIVQTAFCRFLCPLITVVVAFE
ncbi:hypothetical protein D3C80_1703130 [compost metagenome]